MLLTLGSPRGDRDKAPHFVPPEDRAKPLRHKLADTEPRALIQKPSKTEVTPSPTPGPLGQGRAPLTRRFPGSIPPTQVTQTLGNRGLTPRAARANPGVEFAGGRAPRSPPPRAAVTARQAAAAQQPTSPLLPVPPGAPTPLGSCSHHHGRTLLKLDPKPRWCRPGARRGREAAHAGRGGA